MFESEFTFNLLLLIEFLEAHEYPEHIKQLVQKERELEEQEKRQREIERNTCKVRIPVCITVDL